MVTVRIKDHVEYAYTYEEGQKIYDLIAPVLASGKPVLLSFEGFKAVPSSFLNAAVLQLADSMEIIRIQQLLNIENSTIQINEMIRRSFKTIQDKAKN